MCQKHTEFECNILSFDGRKIPVLIHANTLNDDSGASIGKMAFVTDMTEHKKAIALAGEVQRSLLPNRAPQVEGLDISGKNVACNESFEELKGPGLALGIDKSIAYQVN